MKRLYYKIDCEEARRLELKGSEKDVYFFIRSFKEGVTMGQERMAERLCMSPRSLKSCLARLKGRDLIRCADSEFFVKGGRLIIYTAEIPCAKSAQGEVQNLHRVGAKSAQGEVQNLHRVGADFAEGPIYNDKQVIEQVIVTRDNTTKNAPKKIQISELVLEVWTDHYRVVMGTSYVPDWSTVTTDREQIGAAVEVKMEEMGMDAGDAMEVREFLSDMYDAMYSAADRWQKKHWTLHTVAGQFNQLYQAIKNNENERNTENRGVTDDHLAELMRYAAGVVQPGDDKE